MRSTGKTPEFSFLRISGILSSLYNPFLIIFALFLLLIPTINNGFPILFPDLGTYISSGFSNHVPIDRPILYGLFVRRISFGTNLFLVVICQSIVLVYLILLVVKYIFDCKKMVVPAAVISILFLSLTTGIGYVVNHLMPDIFTAYCLLAIAVLVAYNNKLPALHTVLVSVVLVFSIMTHNSNLLVVFCEVVVLAVLFALIRQVIYVKRITLAACLIAISWVLQPTINFLYGYGFKVSRVTNIFFTGNLIEEGIFQDFLDDKCSRDSDYFFCDQRDIVPSQIGDFLWIAEDNFLYDSACISNHWENCWSSKDSILGQINKDILSNPFYLRRFVSASTRKFFQQLILFRLDQRSPHGESSPVYNVLKVRYPDQFEIYKKSAQYKSPLQFKKLTFIQYICVGVSLIYIVVFLVSSRLRKKDIGNIEIYLLITLSFYLTNTLICSVFSIVSNRYNNRIVFLIPLAAFLLIFRLILFSNTSRKISLRSLKFGN